MKNVYIYKGGWDCKSKDYLLKALSKQIHYVY